MPHAEGKELAGRYKIKKHLTSEQLRNVYLAEDKSERTYCILREYSPSALKAEDMKSRRQGFRDSIARLKDCRHPNLARFMGSFTDGGLEYVVSEYIEGMTLQSRLEKDPHVTPVQAISWGMQVSDLLEYLQSVGFVGDMVSPEHLQLNEASQLEQISYGLERFFLPEPMQPLFTEDKAELQQQFVRYGKWLQSLARLLGPEQVETAQELDRIAQGCINKGYTSFKDVRRELHALTQKSTAEPPERDLVTYEYKVRANGQVLTGQVRAVDEAAARSQLPAGEVLSLMSASDALVARLKKATLVTMLVVLVVGAGVFIERMLARPRASMMVLQSNGEVAGIDHRYREVALKVPTSATGDMVVPPPAGSL